MTFLLGLTWVFGLFAVGEATLAFQYIFTILNTMQGNLMHLYSCLLIYIFFPHAISLKHEHICDLIITRHFSISSPYLRSCKVTYARNTVLFKRLLGTFCTTPNAMSTDLQLHLQGLKIYGRKIPSKHY